MYDLPPDFNPKVFDGAVLTLIGFGVGTIHLTFTLKHPEPSRRYVSTDVVAQSPIKLFVSDAEHLIPVGGYADIAQLGVLLNADVTSASLCGKRCLRLDFGPIGSVQIDDDYSGYEAYAIYGIASDAIIV